MLWSAYLQSIRNTQRKNNRMKKLNLNLIKDKKYVVACSFGPDSMALLSATLENGLNIVVAHVNYHKRDVSNYEERSLKEFCASRNIPCEVLDTTGLKCDKNFQEWARELRYKFFSDVVKKYNADAVLVAHQEDDVIETYLMQKKRGNIVKNAGIAEEIQIQGTKILRPLLSYSKQFLKDYDDENNIPYSIDASNLSDDYERNKIRHHVVAKMSEEERQQIINECTSTCNKRINIKSTFSLNEFKKINYFDFVMIADHFMNLVGEHTDLSQKFFKEILKTLASTHCVSFNITNSVRLEKNYDFVEFVNAQKIKEYSYKFSGKFKNDFIEIDFTQGAEDRGLQTNNNCLILRNILPTDSYFINNYKKEIKRLYIDWKMPLYLRKVWPGIYNEKGELLYTPRYRKNYVDNHKSIFKIDTEYFKKFD